MYTVICIIIHVVFCLLINDIDSFVRTCNIIETECTVKFRKSHLAHKFRKPQTYLRSVEEISKKSIRIDRNSLLRNESKSRP